MGSIGLRIHVNGGASELGSDNAYNGGVGLFVEITLLDLQITEEKKSVFQIVGERLFVL